MSDKFPGGLVTTGAPAGFSVAFDGSGDYLTTPTNTAFNIFGGDMTMECWFYQTSTTNTSQHIFAFVETGTNRESLYFNGTTLTFWTSNGAGSGPRITYAAPTINTWHHVAVVKSGSTFTMYVDGVSAGTSSTTQYSTANQLMRVATYDGTVGNDYFTGYISNVRVVKGTALYTSTFTPPTQLFNVTNTSLLTCQNPTIIDNSTNAFAITVTGDTKVSNFTPFAGYTGFNPALGAAAGGVWTLDEAAYYQNNRKWPIYDPYFNQTTLMLHGNGTNGAQNNTFLDSSTNNFTITRNGNTTQGTFTPFSQTGWSYNGTAGAYCQLNNADYAIGTGDFTIEFWMYCTDDSGSRAFAGLPGAGVLTISMTSGSSGARQPYMEFGGAGTLFTAFSGYLNRWTHVAFVRSSGTITVYQNGVALSSASKAASFPNSANLYLARLPTDTTQDFIGYLSNYRITKSAVYSSNFTPSTVPFVPVSNTVLLAFQDNRFVDNSALKATVTPAGTASVQAFSPFVPAYITPTTYSNYFSGSASYLSGASNAALVFGTGTYTIEMWVYQNARSGTQYVLGGGGGFQLAINSTGNIFGGVAGVGDFTAATVAASLNTWTHIVIVRNSTSAGGVAYYVNGIAAGTATDANNYTTNNTLNIATTNGNTGVTPFSGCISNLRVLKGTALYTAAFTPPTAPLTAITNTSLLTCQSSTIIDNSTNAFTITANGSVQPVTSPTPFPAKVDQTTLNSAYSTSLIGGSAYFDGTGDYLTAANNTALQLSSSDFTIEGWVYVSASSGSLQTFIAKGTGAGNQASYAIQLNTSNQWTYYLSGNGSTWSIASGVFMGGVSLNSWNHVALVRSGSTFTPYVNGIAGTTTTSATALFSGTAVLSVGSDDAAASRLTGYVAGSRVIKGTALYTSNFAPPLAPPTAVTNTQLLLNYTNAGIIDNTANNALETVGSAQISTAQSKFGGSSMYMPATNGNYFNGKTNPTNLFFGTGNFTIECWVYPTAFTNAAAGILGVGTSGGYIDYVLEVSTSGTVSYIDANASRFSSSSNLSTNTWTHVCLARTSSAVTLYFNGVSVGTVSTISNISGTSTSSLYVGTGPQVPGSRQFIGYIDDLRITKGVARYTTNFTPPTSQLQDQ